MGARSRNAHATPLTTDAAPGPSVVRHAPGLPVISACAIAAIAAAVSVEVSTNGSPAFSAASIRSRLPPPPGTPNSARTPAEQRRATITSATVTISRPWYSDMIGRFMAIELHQDLRSGVRDLCKNFPDTYWRELDAQRA